MSSTQRGRLSLLLWRIVDAPEVVVGWLLRRPGSRVENRLARRGGEIHEEGGGDLSAGPVPSQVHSIARCETRASVDVCLERAVQVDLLALVHPADALIGFRPRILELAAHATEQNTMPVPYAVEEPATVRSGEPLFEQSTPAAEVDAPSAIPFVDEEAPLAAAHLPERAPQCCAVHLRAAVELVHRASHCLVRGGPRQLVRWQALAARALLPTNLESEAYLLCKPQENLQRDCGPGLGQSVEQLLGALDPEPQLGQLELWPTAELDRRQVSLDALERRRRLRLAGLSARKARLLWRGPGGSRARLLERVAEQLETLDRPSGTRVDVSPGVADSRQLAQHGRQETGRVRLQQGSHGCLERVADQRLQERRCPIDHGVRSAEAEREGHRAIQIPAQAGVRAEETTVDAIVLEDTEEHAQEASFVEAVEELLELAGPDQGALRLAQPELRDARARELQLELVGPELEVAELVHERDPVEPEVGARLLEFTNLLRQVDEQPVAHRKRECRRPEALGQSLQWLETEDPTRYALTEERQQALRVDQVHRL